jgi:hypothetical protein
LSARAIPHLKLGGITGELLTSSIRSTCSSKGGVPMTDRERLPDRRASITFDFEVGGLRYTATVSRFNDGRIGELFINNHKTNSSADTNARDAAITFSIAVQHGADPEVIRRALCRNSDGSASGPLGMALDLIAADQ